MSDHDSKISLLLTRDEAIAVSNALNYMAAGCDANECSTLTGASPKQIQAIFDRLKQNLDETDT